MDIICFSARDEDQIRASFVITFTQVKAYCIRAFNAEELSDQLKEKFYFAKIIAVH